MILIFFLYGVVGGVNLIVHWEDLEAGFISSSFVL